MKYDYPLQYSPEGFHDEMDRVKIGKTAGNRWCLSADPAAFLWVRGACGGIGVGTEIGVVEANGAAVLEESWEEGIGVGTGIGIGTEIVQLATSN